MRLGCRQASLTGHSETRGVSRRSGRWSRCARSGRPLSQRTAEAKELLLHAIYDWNVVEGPTIVKARLTPAARC
jgi:hypothetical protein